ncbi:hypothetical protein Taro_026581 [Colocasia esculenta]|uniref:Uncharacterized protein n=1 Tax=Colocasia esculenta TaxID=4460 RepID=A0A843V6I8_COLES|nr:hypothetical protein [Colocasia esculenta]
MAAGEQEIVNTKPFFFPFSSAATCTNRPLEVDQRTPKHHGCLNTLHQTLGDEFKSCWGHVGEFTAAGEQEIVHTKPFFFPFSSAATCTNCPLEVDQRADNTLSLPEELSGKGVVAYLVNGNKGRRQPRILTAAKLAVKFLSVQNTD